MYHVPIVHLPHLYVDGQTTLHHLCAFENHSLFYLRQSLVI